jgi:hypothetical protein
VREAGIRDRQIFRASELHGGNMRADRVEISWDNEKAKWLIRIEAGEEVVRRHCDLPHNADEATLRAAAQKTVQDEGYDAAASSVILRM